ncbi:unnamed protein product [Aureobasidium uvarum]|uniref:Uncharacterized protein n=1 Tax=Aureobasidium uvarum TaxID=2773716 RepID=A0A9N8PV63_9PEZI|nr:unnamed protein product [Aureobasidium uvarum]
MASFSNTTITYDEVRAAMKKPLTAEEQKKYRGITDSAMSGLKYDELFGINTSEELIIAESYGRQATPSDDPDNLYLFSAGHGLTARFNQLYRQTTLESQSTVPETVQAASIANRTTIEQMHNQYLNMPKRPGSDDKAYVENQLSMVATDFVTWWNELSTESQGLERRQQGYYCNDQNQHCATKDDCKKTRTIQRLKCTCGNYGTCSTGDLPLPPYCPHGDCGQ